MRRPAMSVLIGSIDPRETASLARQYEHDGWDGIYCVDSQCIGADVYAQLTLVAAATERVELGPWVTNPATRHPAVTANAITTVDVLAVGRAVLGIGRGDSALAHLGASPTPIKPFSRYLAAVRSYLSGRGIGVDEA